MCVRAVSVTFTALLDDDRRHLTSLCSDNSAADECDDQLALDYCRQVNSSQKRSDHGDTPAVVPLSV